MNKNLLLTIFLAATAITGVLIKTQAQTENTLGQSKYINEFKQFIGDFQRIYSIEEFQTRYENFQQNMEIVETQNDLYNNGKSTYFLGTNHISDLSTAEFKKHFLGYNAAEQQEQQLDIDQNQSEVLASSVDWINQGAVNAVKNQGQCGSCWAFSSIGAMEGLNAIQGNGLQQFSEQSLMDCSVSYGNNGCNGGLMDNAFKYLAKSGVATEASYPYTAKDGSCRSYTSAFKNRSYKDVMKYSDYFFTKALNVNPVSVAIEADQRSFQLYKGGIYDDSSCGTQLDHGVLAVGYGEDYLKIRNSWGPSWGDHGYIKFARKQGFSSGQCGVYKSASYPTA